ncbi:MAG: hypothetical protein JWN40_1368, partial [Phycisphaerales bacterium]|nr:hypothetical protein [Phycisphaerales bacterium]
MQIPPTRIVALFLLLSVAVSTICTAAPPRLAILGDPASPLPDLLTVRLSESHDLTLVERTQLRAVATEQTLQAAMGNRADRGRIGALVPADLLLLLSTPADTSLPARLVICDARLGVTLDDLCVPRPAAGDRDALDKLTTALAAETLATVHRFDRGVTRVVAIPDFVSRDLLFDRAFLQTDYAETLRAACLRLPGAALVSIEEARAIAEERAQSAVKQQACPAPLFVEGEYRTRRDPATGVVTVALTCRARDGQHTLAQRDPEPPIPLAEVGLALLRFFNVDLAPLLADAATPERPKPVADVDAQFRLLTDRAQQFFTLGEFHRAAQLREAALLLKPDADAQRIQLIREYSRRNQQPVERGQWPKGARQHKDDPFWTAVVAQVVSDWNRSLQHCEYLIRNRRLSREEATDLTHNAIHSITGVRATSPPALVACETAKKEFVRNVFARVPALDRAERRARGAMTGALDASFFLIDSALFRCDGNFFAPEDLDLLADLLLKLAPASITPAYNLSFFFEHVAQRQGGKDYCRFTNAQYLAFLDRLTKSDRPLVQIYGRYGKVAYRTWTGHERTAELLAEARDVAAAAGRLEFDARQYDYFLTQLRDHAGFLAREMPSAKAADATPAKPRTTVRPAVAATTTSSTRPTAAAARDDKPRLTIEPIELTLHSPSKPPAKLTPATRWRGAGGWGQINHYRPLGDGLDAFWGHGAVLFMREKGIVEEVLAVPQPQDPSKETKEIKLSVSDVITDGPHVWVAAAYGRGLYVFDRQGKQLALIDAAHGLPPTDIIGPQLHPVAPGRVLATGSFGNEHRGWIAFVEFDDKDPAHPKVDLFHEAAKVWDHKRTDNPDNLDPAMCFEPEFVFEHTTAGPDPRRLVFISRRYNPLVVDLAARRVWVYPVRKWSTDAFPRTEGPAEAFQSIDGVLWIAGSDRDLRSYRLDNPAGLFTPLRERPNWHIG